MNIHGQIVWGLFLFLLTIGLSACRSYTYSYEIENTPEYKGDFRSNQHASDFIKEDSINVVSFNIEFARNIEGAIKLFQDPPLQNADVILLQEMDEKGTAAIAQSMQMSYVYYPAIYHPIHKKNVGNAILSKWEILNSEKLMLPHPSWYPAPLKGKRYIFRKTATIADVVIQDQVIKFVSTHAAAFNTTNKRKEFAEALVRETSSNSNPQKVVIGGDFNSLGGADIHVTAQSFISKGFIWASAQLGKTISEKKSILKPLPSAAFQLDHLFVKGMTVVETGKVEQKSVSDHLPIYTVLVIQ